MPVEFVAELTTLPRRDGRMRRAKVNLSIGHLETIIRRANIYRSMIADEGYLSELHYNGPDILWYNEEGGRDDPTTAKMIVLGVHGGGTGEVIGVAWQAQFARNDSFFRTRTISVGHLNRERLRLLAPPTAAAG